MTIDSDKGEKLSSFIDGELSREHCETLISSICKDEDMKSCLARYQIISDSMKNQLPDGIKKDFVHCVMSAIDSEPTILAPSRSTPRKHVSSGNVIYIPSFAKKVAGFAIAASVATIAIVGVQNQNQDPGSQVVAMPENSEFVRLQNQASMTASTDPVIIPKSTSGYSTASSPITRNSIPQLKPTHKFDPVLQQYIVNHAQYASGSGVNDIFSHARIVASSQEKQSADQGKQ